MTEDGSQITQVLAATRCIAVLGAHPEPSRAAFYVPEHMHAHGYRVLPVNPAYAGRELFGERVRGSLAELGEPVDLVNVFRRSEALAGHLPEILALAPRPRAVWLQLGIRDDAFAAALRAAGIAVVEGHCLMVEHRRYAARPR
ncbi:MAG: CoA-binding protein [Myxococcales bacterium]|nr:CoA-binding protein [Myxococcales bacterium]